jgi:hypothetical protein
MPSRYERGEGGYGDHTNGDEQQSCKVAVFVGAGADKSR